MGVTDGLSVQEGVGEAMCCRFLVVAQSVESQEMASTA